MPDWCEKSAVVEPVDPFEGCELGGLQAAPRPAGADDLGLEQPDHCLGQRVDAPMFVKRRRSGLSVRIGGGRFHE